jgi:hypothetical protein
MIKKKASYHLDSPLGALLDIITRSRIVRQPYDPRKPIQTVPHGDIQRLPEDPVLLLRVGDDLSVPAGDVKDDWVVRCGDVAAHLDVCREDWYMRG